ncbi:MAG: DUF3106 domain-containing protein [Betaproteobacteria bacterium]|nr:DUF3106 domain-containing protein [Betaproteobacteria bacterium]
MAQARFRRIPRALTLALFVLCSDAALAAPKWQALSAADKKTLAPLSAEWDGMPSVSQQKWLGIARRYPSMTPAEQARITTRMQEWVELSPEQRRKARQQYKRLQKLPPNQRPELRERWKTYESLSSEEKSRLRISDKPKSPPKSDIYTPIPAEWLVPPYLRNQRVPKLTTIRTNPSD